MRSLKVPRHNKTSGYVLMRTGVRVTGKLKSSMLHKYIDLIIVLIVLVSVFCMIKHYLLTNFYYKFKCLFVTQPSIQI